MNIQTAPSPFSRTVPTFQVARTVFGFLIPVKRLNRFCELIKIQEDGCWQFCGPKTHNGYGSFGIGGRSGTNVRAHRLAYELFIGPIPKDLLVLHTCDFRSCCNPSHLKLGTAFDNTKDMIEKGRAKLANNVSTWSAEKSALAVAMKTEGYSHRQIGEALGYSHEGVRFHLMEIGAWTPRRRSV